MTTVITPATVRDYLRLNSPGSSSQYSDATIGSNIRAAQGFLERKCRRFFHDHPGVTWSTTTLLAAQVPLPGFRAFTSATWGGVTLSIAVPGDGNTSPSAWGVWEPSEGIEDGRRLVLALQFRPWRVDNDRPWYWADSQWWDKGLDNPFFPGNWGGGYAWTSMPNDLVIVGDGGYAPGYEPEPYLNAVKVLAAWYTVRPSSVLSDVALTPGRSELEYQSYPEEVAEFIADWKAGRQAVSVG